MYRHVVMFPVGVLVDDAHFKQRGIKKMQMLVRIRVLDVDGELSFQNEIGRLRLGNDSDFVDAQRLLDDLQIVYHHSLGITFNSSFPRQFSVDVSDKLIANPSFVEMPQPAHNDVHPFDTLASLKCLPCMISAHFISHHTFHTADGDFVLRPAAGKNEYKPDKAEVQTTEKPGCQAGHHDNLRVTVGLMNGR